MVDLGLDSSSSTGTAYRLFACTTHLTYNTSPTPSLFTKPYLTSGDCLSTRPNPSIMR